MRDVYSRPLHFGIANAVAAIWDVVEAVSGRTFAFVEESPEKSVVRSVIGRIELKRDVDENARVIGPTEADGKRSPSQWSASTK